MLSLYTSGSKYSRRRCESVVSWFMQKYLPKHKIEVEVLHRGLLREGVYGWCTVTDCNWKPRSFLIEIHNHLSPEDYIKKKWAIALATFYDVFYHWYYRLDFKTTLTFRLKCNGDYAIGTRKQ